MVWSGLVWSGMVWYAVLWAHTSKKQAISEKLRLAFLGTPSKTKIILSGRSYTKPYTIPHALSLKIQRI